MPCLTELLDCHVNVDVCFTVNVFMYLYKYLFKGPDRAKFAIRVAGVDQDPVNEVEDYVKARYLSASEAAWRICSFDITTKTPAVVPIPVHLPGANFHQMMRRDQDASTASKLLRYFARPRLPEFRALRILEYYSTYRLESYNLWSPPPLGEGRWLEEEREGFRQQIVIRRVRATKVVSRLHTVPPRMGELYYLRSLLLHRPADSFEDLRTVLGVVHPTFQEAATALGLFSDQTEAEQCMEEAVRGCYSPAQ